MIEERDGTIAIIFYLLVESEDVLLYLCDAPTVPNFLVGRAYHNEVELLFIIDLVVHLNAEGKLIVDKLQYFLVVSFLLGEYLSIEVSCLFSSLRFRLLLLFLFVQPHNQVMLATEHFVRVLEIC